ncbi:MAG TPA: UDP-phosphate galactose phosphotransferase, partial [Leuconostoc lactis]|nr:UDP-phosphate galactose phosphotransferase [Leuconostoc lactis]
MGVFYRNFLKRVLDIIVAITLGIVLIVPLFFVAILVKLTSKGPVFFKQERFWLNSKHF